MNDGQIKLLETILTESKTLKPGEDKIINCPDCGSKLRLSRNSSNGHLWAVCESCGVKLMQ